METINLFLIDMSQADNTSGVDRYLTTLLRGLSPYSCVKVCWLHLRQDNNRLFPKEEFFDTYTKITMPLPQQLHEIINEEYWLQKYNEQVFRIIEHLFRDKSRCVLHLHTLNLIDLALYIRERIAYCKIVTHLHCLPWKGVYNFYLSSQQQSMD